MSYDTGAAAPATSDGIPAHVPPDRVIRGAMPGMDPGSCPYDQSAALHDGPRALYMPANFMMPTGAWIISRVEDIRQVFQNPEVFSSDGIAGFSRMVGEAWPLIPLELDPPDHGKYRTLLNGIFSPAKMKSLEDGVRSRAAALIEAVKDKGECEFNAAFGRPFPVLIFMQIMGLPEADFETLIGWEHDLLHAGFDMEQRVRGAQGFLVYLRELIAKRRAEPKDDLATFVAQAEVDGRPMTDDEVLGIYYLLVVAGLDTVAASLGLYFRHLAQHPEDQARLRADPSLIPGAAEELLRRYGIVMTSRYITRDADMADVKVKAGERVMIPTMAGSLDPTEFENPLEVDIERPVNRHVSFAYGPHRCLGSHLARRELIIAIEEWLKRVPAFGIKDGQDVPVKSGGLLCVETLPLVWG